MRSIMPLWAVLAFVAVAQFSNAEPNPSRTLAPTDSEYSRFKIDGILATVNGEVITIEHMRDVVSDRALMDEIYPLAYAENFGRANEADNYQQTLKAAIDAALQYLIDSVLITQAFDSDKSSHLKAPELSHYIDEKVKERTADWPTPYASCEDLKKSSIDPEEFTRKYKVQFIKEYLLKRQLEQMPLEITKANIQNYYKSHLGKFTLNSDRIYLRLIQLNRTENETDEQLRARAQAIMDKIKSTKDMIDLAKLHSMDTRAARGGDWGWQSLFGPSPDLKPEIAEPLSKLPVGNMLLFFNPNVSTDIVGSSHIFVGETVAGKADVRGTGVLGTPKKAMKHW